MYQAVYPVIGKQTSLPIYLYGIGLYDPENPTNRPEGLVSHQLQITLEGKGSIHVGDSDYIAEPGTIFYMAPGISHEYHPLGSHWKTGWVVFRGNCLNRIMKDLGYGDYFCKKSADISQIAKLFQMIFAAAEDSINGAQKCSLLLYDYVLSVREKTILNNENTEESLIDPAISLMDRNYYQDISLPDLANLCHISQQHFCRLFRIRTGMRPLDYLARRRILEAKDLLHHTKYSISDIGKMTGYSDPTYFGIVFKKYEGISPSQYRKMNLSTVI